MTNKQTKKVQSLIDRMKNDVQSGEEPPETTIKELWDSINQGFVAEGIQIPDDNYGAIPQ